MAGIAGNDERPADHMLDRRARYTAGTQQAFDPSLNAEIPEPRFDLGTHTDVDRAATLAREVEGVKSVTNNLSVS